MKTVIHLHEDFCRPEWKDWMSELPERVAGVPPPQVIRSGRNRVFRIEHLGRELVVKHFRNTGPWKKIAYRFATGKARRSFEHSIALMNAGLRCPQPVGWREDWRNGFLKESFFVSAHVGIAHTARALRAGNGCDWRPQAERIARSIARMHDAEILHRDLTAGNILFVESGPDEPPVCFIDNNRMSFGKIGLRKGIASLLQANIEGDYEVPYVAAYAEERGFDPQVCLDLYRSRIAGHKMKWRIKNATRPWRRKIGL